MKPTFCVLAMLAPLGSFLVGSAAVAQIEGQGTGLTPRGIVCRNSTTGQLLVLPMTHFAWNCGSLGLESTPGDRVETGLRGLAPSPPEGPLLDPSASILPEDFVGRSTSDQYSFWPLAADFDSDGDVDVVGQSPFLWFENLGGSDPVFLEHPLDDLILSGAILEGVIHDVDRDGAADVVAIGETGGSTDALLWFRYAGGSPPTFSRIFLFDETGWAMASPHGGDIDDDGDMDFVVYRVDLVDCIPGQCAEQTVLLENLGGSMVPRVLAASGGPSRFVDLDLDGDLDLVNGARDPGRLRWFENEGGVLLPEQVLLLAEKVDELRTSDLDLDGDPDLIVTDFDFFSNAPDKTYWLENLGDATFVQHPLDSSDSASQSRELVVTDLTGEGLPDLVVRNDHLSWMQNLGGSPPKFVKHEVDVPLGANPFIGTGAGDINGDGRVDLVATSVELGSQWLENQIGTRLSVDGISVSRFLCRNLTTGESIVVPTTDKAVDCESEGLLVEPGHEIEVLARGNAE